MDFYMIRHYSYDGYSGHDQDDVIPFHTSQEAVDYLNERRIAGSLAEYEWETDWAGFQILIDRGNHDEYDYYFLEKMTMGKEID